MRVLSLCCVVCSFAGLPFWLSTDLLATRRDAHLQITSAHRFVEEMRQLAGITRNLVADEISGRDKQTMRTSMTSSGEKHERSCR